MVKDERHRGKKLRSLHRHATRSLWLDREEQSEDRKCSEPNQEERYNEMESHGCFRSRKRDE